VLVRAVITSTSLLALRSARRRRRHREQRVLIAPRTRDRKLEMPRLALARARTLLMHPTAAPARNVLLMAIKTQATVRSAYATTPFIWIWSRASPRVLPSVRSPKWCREEPVSIAQRTRFRAKVWPRNAPVQVLSSEIPKTPTSASGVRRIRSNPPATTNHAHAPPHS
jgi:hypothetical protein